MDILEEAIKTRRTIHARPEEGWTEFETSFLVAERLKKLGWSIVVGTDAVDVENVLGRNPETVRRAMERAAGHGVPQEFLDGTNGYTGVVGFFDTGREGPLTAFRFDMDCVQVEESREPGHLPAEQGFTSEIPGMMHACGHDAHTALGLALARWISENKDNLRGSFRFLFQPAEEGTRGAAPMASKGWVDDVDYFFAGHAGMFCKKGEVGICSKGFFATSKIDISFTGIPSHAGSYPERGKSALMAACAAAMMMQGISRTSQGDTRVSIGRLNAGEGRNVTPVHASIQLETRGETEEANAFLVDSVSNVVKGVAESYQVEHEVRIVGRATTLVTSPKGVELLKSVAEEVYDRGGIRYFDRIGGSEDATILFRRAIEHGAEGAFFMWGCDNKGHHRQDFDIQDEETMPLALAFSQKLLTKTNGVKAA